MKKILLAYVILTSYVSAQSLLHCLGAEESHYAKQKYTGPNYRLNQLMIEEISSLSDLKVIPRVYKKICQDKSNYPSLLLLENLIHPKERLFQTSKNQFIEKSSLETIKENSGRLLITYLSYLQTVAKTPKCIEKEIPEIIPLYSRYRYLEDIVDPKDMNGSYNEIKAIFSKLKHADKILERCSQRATKNN
ncbi:hypothetical protein [Bacteriovorax sp. DB6_IX]|uniref:hypothetical protein n=1 Tax=Bacteriovorax sp. DB6_IX TaxID=1353530 RepID=UPI00038A4FC7|nr:hypothetical protein [Bacteriovorax sp. DB6_IX]EQC50443.1 hypothetical protein M901_1490 [Bacteriovorax sp. DB6_IX]